MESLREKGNVVQLIGQPFCPETLLFKKKKKNPARLLFDYFTNQRYN